MNTLNREPPAKRQTETDTEDTRTRRGEESEGAGTDRFMIVLVPPGFGGLGFNDGVLAHISISVLLKCSAWVT